jgi:serralysin
LLFGDAQGMVGQTVGGNDRLAGGEGDDALRGDAQNMGDTARGGADKLEGGDGNDVIDGDAFFIVFGGTVTCGNDRLFGGTGADQLFGDASGLQNGAAATCGNDRLEGGFGDDELWGDVSLNISSITAGSDIFVFKRGSGNDTVGDFNDGATGPQDRLHLDGYRGINAVADLSGFITQHGADTVIDLGAATGQGAGLDTIRLLHTTATDFGANDFLL